MSNDSARLTWSGRVGHDTRLCPTCDAALRIRSSVSAQGTALCPACEARLYVTIKYEWRDGQARLFRDRFRLEPVVDVQQRALAPYTPTLRELWLDGLRDALVPGLLAAIPLVGLALALDGALPAWPIPAWLGVPLAVVVPWLWASRRLGLTAAADQASWRERSAVWAQRLADTAPCAILELAELPGDSSVITLATRLRPSPSQPDDAPDRSRGVPCAGHGAVTPGLGIAQRRH